MTVTVFSVKKERCDNCLKKKIAIYLNKKKIPKKY